MTDDMDDPFLTIDEAAQLLRVSRRMQSAKQQIKRKNERPLIGSRCLVPRQDVAISTTGSTVSETRPVCNWRPCPKYGPLLVHDPNLHREALSLVSPWPNSGLPVKAVAALAAFWAMASQIGSFLAGGYIAGRMRSRWSDAPPHEAEFRDGVHGLLVWALGVVIGAGLLIAAANSVVRSGTELGARVVGGAASAASADPLVYYADVLPRQRSASPRAPPPTPPAADSRH